MRNLRLFKKPNIFYGYWVVLALFFCAFIHSGCGFYVFGLFVNPLQTEFGWSRGEIMVGITIYFFVTGVASPLVGKLVNQHGASKILIIGALIQGIGFLLLTQMHYLWQFYAFFTLIGAGMAASGMIPATTVILNWFKKRPGTALGIMSTGVGGGGVVMAPLIGGYFLPNFGWQISYVVLALVTWILIPLAYFIVRMRPADMGLYPDGMTAEEAAAKEAAAKARTEPQYSEGLNVKLVLATSTFWLIAISFLLGQFSYIGVVQNQTPYLEDIGFNVATAATALGTVSLGSLIGKFGFGWLCDRMPAKYAWAIALGLQAAGVAIFLNIGSASHINTLYLYAIIIGLGIGGWLPTMSMLVKTYFGMASYAVIYGVLTLVGNTGTAMGPIFAGFMYDAMGTYQQAFTILLILYAFSIPTALFIRRSKLPIIN
ncbi:MFS transporter [Chloroflexota bacterium]